MTGGFFPLSVSPRFSCSQAPAVKCGADQLPLQIDFVQAAQAKAPKAEHAFNNPKDRFDAALAQPVEARSLGALQPLTHALTQLLWELTPPAFALRRASFCRALPVVRHLQRAINSRASGAFHF